MKTLLFVTNLPSPYRVDFFNELTKYYDVFVAYERTAAANRNAAWVNNSELKFHQEYLECKEFGEERSIGFKVINYIKDKSFDYLIFGGYSSPSIILAILYAQNKGMKYYIESDGGFFQKDSGIKYIIKKRLIEKAEGIFITCEEEYAFFEQYGFDRKKICKYPFTSLYAKDIIDKACSTETKQTLRKEIGLVENRIIISVGRIIPSKGFDTLIKAQKSISGEIGVYIIGGESTPDLEQLIENLHATNIHFVPFMNKTELRKYYCAADLFVLPTREDVWGLVVNEAMACGLPVLTTYRCGAGVEMIKHGQNGYLVEPEDCESIANIVENYFSCTEQKDMAFKALETVRQYTFERMALAHKEFLDQ